MRRRGPAICYRASLASFGRTMPAVSFRFTVNGSAVRVAAAADTPLLDV
jgi:hypothetical protein